MVWPWSSIRSLKKKILGQSLQDVREAYTLGEELGKGEMAVIHAAKDKLTGEEVAIKTFKKSNLKTKEEVEEVKTEHQILKLLAGHPNIITLKRAMEDKNEVNLVLEKCSGGELFDTIAAKGMFTEGAAANLMKGILSAVKHCHDKNVAHRSISAENFLMESKSEDSGAKIIDFGTATIIKPGKPLTEVIGAPLYIAPEVLREKYGKECDIWSCGVILYILLSGIPPFWGETQKDIFKAVLAAKPDLSTFPWPKVSQPAKDLVQRMLTPNPSQRITAAEALAHPWFTAPGAAENPVGADVVKRLKKFSANNKMKKLALQVVACCLPRKKIEEMKRMFKEMDKNGDGTITLAELKEGMSRLGSALPEQQLKRLMEAADVDNDGKIDYSEFIAATLQLNQVAQEEHLIAAFRHFDANGDGDITKEELRQALSNNDMLDVEPGEVETILAEVDKDGDGKIDYEEFADMMRARSMSREEPETALKTRTKAVF